MKHIIIRRLAYPYLCCCYYLMITAAFVQVKMINGDEGLDRNSMFADSRLEKELRAKLLAEVQRELGPDSLIILDAHNYIKGYR